MTATSSRASCCSGTSAARPRAVRARCAWRASASDVVRRDEPALGEALEDAARVAAVDVQGLRKINGGRLRVAGRSGVAVIPDLVEHASFGQRERAMEEFFLQHANLARVEAVEPADGVDVLRECGSGHVRSSVEWPGGGLPG